MRCDNRPLYCNQRMMVILAGEMPRVSSPEAWASKNVPLAGSRPHALAVMDTDTSKPLPAQRAFNEGLARVTALG